MANKRRKKERKMKFNSKVCPHCGGEMSCRGVSGVCGGTRWRCKNKSCGQSLIERKIPISPKPLILR